MNKKLAVVSGSTKGIGKATAIMLAEMGLIPVINGRNLDSILATVNGIKKQLNIEPLYFQADLSKKEQAVEFGKFCLSHQKDIGILVNNAGIFLPGNFLDEEDSDFELMMNTNLNSAYYLTKTILPKLIEQKSGSIFNICSIASLQAYPNSFSYTISKFALLGFSKSLREELKPYKIKVTSVLPGATYTQSWEGSGLPPERFIQDKDIAKAIKDTYSLSDSVVVDEIILRPQFGDI